MFQLNCLIEDLTLDNLGDASANTKILRGGRQDNQRWLDQAESKGASMDSRRRQRKSCMMRAMSQGIEFDF